MKINQFFNANKYQVMSNYAKYRRVVFGRNIWHIHKKPVPSAPVCLMAHVDTVLPATMPTIRGDKILARGLDDRLGVYMALMLFENRNDVDVIICDDEEIGRSTADLLTKRDLQSYNFIFELDRAGDDFVHYGCANDDLIGELSKYRKEGLGAFSDIDFIKDEARQCGCANIGIGYEKAHSEDSYAYIDKIISTIDFLNEFIDKNKTRKFERSNKDNFYRFSSFGSYGSYSYTSYDGDVMCEYCGDIVPEDAAVWYGKDEYSCRHCAIKMGVLFCPVCDEALAEEEYKYGICFGCIEDNGLSRKTVEEFGQYNGRSW
jgi:hypothetical protein